MTSIGKENRSSQCLSYKKKKKSKGEGEEKEEEKRGGESGGGGGALSQAVGRTGWSFMGV